MTVAPHSSRMLTLAEIHDLLTHPDPQPLYTQARQVADNVFGKNIWLRGVVEFSNHCGRNCRYCGLRQANTALERFRLDEEAMLTAARCVAEYGMGTVVLQCGEDSAFTVEQIGRVIRSIKDTLSVAVTLSLGEHEEDAYRYWRDCGADRYLLKLETTDPELHTRLRPAQDVRTRLAHVETLQRLGYQVGSGIITGLPDMTTDILARDIHTLAGMGLDMIAAGPFIPHPGTPEGHRAAGSLEDALRTTSLLRLLCPEANIPATSALDALAPRTQSAFAHRAEPYSDAGALSDAVEIAEAALEVPLTPSGREQGLAAGANVVMPSVTPENVRRKYNIYPGKNIASTPVADAVEDLKQRIIAAGYLLSADRGDSIAFTRSSGATDTP